VKPCAGWGSPAPWLDLRKHTPITGPGEALRRMGSRKHTRKLIGRGPGRESPPCEPFVCVLPCLVGPQGFPKQRSGGVLPCLVGAQGLPLIRGLGGMGSSAALCSVVLSPKPLRQKLAPGATASASGSTTAICSVVSSPSHYAKTGAWHHCVCFRPHRRYR
jgi:hypothetical protein